MKKLIYILTILLFTSCAVQDDEGKIVEILDYKEGLCIAKVKFEPHDSSIWKFQAYTEHAVPCDKYTVGDKIQLMKE